MEVETLRLIARIGVATFGAPALLCAAVWLARAARRSPRRYCPGPIRRVIWRLFPPAWFFSRPCGYDLTGLPQRESGRVACPECGRELVAARHALRRVHRWRAGRAAALLLTLAIVSTAPYLLKITSWQRRVPTTVLILTKRVIGAHLPPRLSIELEHRLDSGLLTDLQRRWIAPALSADLRDDAVMRNASKAQYFLARLGEHGRAQLERSLRSSCPQERRLAAEALREMVVPLESCFPRPCERYGLACQRIAAEPTDDLLRVTFENLDEWCGWRRGVQHAGNPYAFLALFPDRVRPLVTAGLADPDPMRRLWSAGMAVMLADETLYPAAAAILIEHLRNNKHYRDARYAARALHCMGPAAEPFLLAHLYSGDDQQRELVRLVIQNLAVDADQFPLDRLNALTRGGVIASREVWSTNQ